MRIFWLAAVAVTVAALGCASLHKKGNDDDRPHPVEVEITNNLAVPTEVTVFVVQTGGGTRQMLGTVPGTEVKSFTFTPITLSQEYRLVAERALERPVFSQPFRIGSPETGLLEWSLLENIIAFRDLPEDSIPAAKP
ncbi:MAG TPA: hypothetical protein VK688_07705 [Gemmatimonadales bacterium]|nr:hypothetical protein [Gemmatimonadales bacterium]